MTMMLFNKGELSLTEAAERAVENADVKTLMGFLKKNPNTPIVPLLSKAIKLLESVPV